MLAKSFIALLVLWTQWHPAALGQDLAMLDGKSAAERLIWVNHFVEEELNQQDSTAAFALINQLLTFAHTWDAPEIEAEIYTGQGNYWLEVMQDPQTALHSYAQGLELAKAHDLELATGGLFVQIGKAYAQLGQSVAAYEYFLRAHDLFVKEDFKSVPRIDRYEYEIGRFFYELEDARTALEHLSIADLYPGNSRPLRYEVLALIARCYGSLEQQEMSLVYQKKVLQLAQKENNKEWKGRISVEIGELYLRDKQYAEARIYLTTASRLNDHTGNLTLAARSLILLAKVNVYEGNYQAAAQKLKEAENYLQVTCDENWFPALYLGWVEVYERTLNFRDAYRYRLLYDYVQYPIQRAEDLRRDSNFQKRREARQHYAQILLAQKKQNSDRLLLITFLFLITCISIFGFLVFQRFQNRQRDLMHAKRSVEKELEKMIELNAVSPPIVHEKNLAVAVPQDKGTDVPVVLEKPLLNAKEAMDQMLHLRLLTEEDSRKFRQILEHIFPGFIAEIRLNYPELTQSEVRLLALTKINLSTKEMSEILNIEANSIRRSRNRIRQKLNLPTGDNFESVLTAPKVEE